MLHQAVNLPASHLYEAVELGLRCFKSFRSTSNIGGTRKVRAVLTPRNYNRQCSIDSICDQLWKIGCTRINFLEQTIKSLLDGIIIMLLIFELAVIFDSYVENAWHSYRDRKS